MDSITDRQIFDDRATRPFGVQSAAMLAHARVQLTYAWRHHRFARVKQPLLFTEFVQHRKLYERDPRLPKLADKLMVKEAVAATLGREWIIPTLWRGIDLPTTLPMSAPFVVKSRHGCNQRAFIRTLDEDWEAIRRRARRWVTSRYGFWLDEWLYSQIEPGLLIEPFVGTDGVLPIDYKLFVFGGEVAFVQVHLDREHAHRWIVLDRDWHPVRSGEHVPARPRSLPGMIEAAEILGQSFDFVRIDFYEVNGVPKFGEITFYPGSGLEPFDPPELDSIMGTLWRDARCPDHLRDRDICAAAGKKRRSPQQRNVQSHI